MKKRQAVKALALSGFLSLALSTQSAAAGARHQALQSPTTPLDRMIEWIQMAVEPLGVAFGQITGGDLAQNSPPKAPSGGANLDGGGCLDPSGNNAPCIGY